MVELELDLADAELLIDRLRAAARSHSARMGYCTSMMSGSERTQEHYRDLRETERVRAEHCRALARRIEVLAREENGN